MSKKTPEYMKKSFNNPESLVKTIKRINKNVNKMQKLGLYTTERFEKLTNPLEGLSYTKSGAISTGKKNIEIISKDKSLLGTIYKRDKYKPGKIKNELTNQIREYLKQPKYKPSKIDLVEYGDKFSNLHDTIMNNLAIIYKNHTLTEALHRKGQLTENEAADLVKFVNGYDEGPIDADEIINNPKITTGDWK